MTLPNGLSQILLNIRFEMNEIWNAYVSQTSVEPTLQVNTQSCTVRFLPNTAANCGRATMKRAYVL
jgi:hypothetical protein